MALTIIRILFLYILANAAVRIMGKRQIGELQPTELVITILLSEIAAIPMQDTDIPILNSVVAVMLLVAFEIISSVIAMKNNKARRFLEGNSVMVIRNGIVDQRQIKRLRYTIEDLMTALRQKDVLSMRFLKLTANSALCSKLMRVRLRQNPYSCSFLTPVCHVLL